MQALFPSPRETTSRARPDGDGITTPDDLALAAAVARQDGHHDIAIAYLTHALTLVPDRADLYFDLSDALSGIGEAAKALGAILRAARLTGATARFYERLGRLLHSQGRLGEAECFLREALPLDPRNPALHSVLGDVFRGRGRSRDAIREYQIALQSDPRDVNALHGLGRAHSQRGEWELALASLQQARAIAPADADVDVDVSTGEALLGLGLDENAVAAFRTALAVDPRNVHASRLYLAVMERIGDAEHLREARLQYADALRSHGHYSEATSTFHRVVRRSPNCLPARFGLARTHLASGRIRLAIRHLEAALRLSPRDAAIHTTLAAALYATGETNRAWDEFAWRYDAAKMPKTSMPLWDGSPLGGRSILLWTDMGRGDVIQFLRYAKFAKVRGGRVVVQCHHPGVIPLIEHMPEVDEVVPHGTTRPSADVHAPLMFFPAVIPASRSWPGIDTPYLGIPAPLVEAWRRTIGRRRELAVGICWGGNIERKAARSRSMPLRMLAPLASVRGVRLISLQHGIQTAELLAPPNNLHLEPLTTMSSSIIDTAALIATLDLVISVDTLVAHLAGALGKPVWVLLPYVASWRWRSVGERTSWYPTMRLFRQARSGDWLGVVDRVARALDAHMKTRTGAA